MLLGLAFTVNVFLAMLYASLNCCSRTPQLCLWTDFFEIFVIDWYNPFMLKRFAVQPVGVGRGVRGGGGGGGGGVCAVAAGRGGVEGDQGIGGESVGGGPRPSAPLATWTCRCWPGQAAPPARGPVRIVLVHIQLFSFDVSLTVYNNSCLAVHFLAYVRAQNRDIQL